MCFFRRATVIMPLFLFSLTASEGTNGPVGLQGAALSVLLMVAWTSVIRDCSATNVQVETFLEQGKRFLAAGQLASALSQYHAAIEADPNNYRSYYHRATVYLAMGKFKSALPDLDMVLKLKPDFNAARLQRANVKLKQGKLDEARVDYQEVLEHDPGSAEARDNLDQLQPLQETIQHSRELVLDKECAHAVAELNRPIELCPWDPELHELRADCYVELGEYSKAVRDLRPTTKLRNDNTGAHLKISKLFYKMGNADDSLNEIRECLKLDSDHKACHDHYKKVKKLAQLLKSIDDHANGQRWADCIAKVEQLRKVENSEDVFIRQGDAHLCHCYAQAKDTSQAFTYCKKVLDAEPDNVDALCDRAETHINSEDFEEGVSDYKRAQELQGEEVSQRVRDGLQRAQKLLKQSQKRDYYKILGIKRTAQKPEITKAYRKLAAKWHPDQYDGDNKKHAEKMFIDIAAAKEVLTDREKREKFDNGEDPLDPEQQAQGGGPHWQQGFNPFGGFQFKFNN